MAKGNSAWQTGLEGGKMDTSGEWWNGIHGGLKIRCPKGLRVRISPRPPSIRF